MKLRWLAAALLLLVALMYAPGRARADDDPEFLPPRLGPADTVTTPRLIDRYPLWRYTWDGDASYQTESGRAAANRMNTLLGYKAWSLKATLRVLHAPLGLQSGQRLAGELDSISGGLTSAFWQGKQMALVTAALTLAGFLALCLGALRGPAAGWSLLVRTTSLLLIALALLLNLGPLLRGLDQLSGELSGATFAAVNPKGAATLDELADALWQPLVMQPWVQGEFGSEGSARRYADNGLPGGQFLRLSGSDRTNRYYQFSFVDRQADFAWWTGDYMLPRQVLAGVTAILTLPVVATGLLIAGGWLLYQLVAVLLVASLPLLLLVALWLPEQGLGLVRRWALRLFTLLVLQVAFGFLLGAWVRLSLVTAGLNLGGWMATDLLLALVALAVLLTRREWLGFMGALVAPGHGAPAGWLSGALQDAVGRRPAVALAAAVREPRASLAALPVAAATLGPEEASSSAAVSPRQSFDQALQLQRRTEVYAQALRRIGEASGAGDEPAPGGATGGIITAVPGPVSERVAAADAADKPPRDPQAISRRALERVRSDKQG